MQLEFPYQIVTFLGKEPNPSEPVYYGKNNWYPQLALKRRFKLAGIDERNLTDLLKDFFSQFDNTEILTSTLMKPERMPVRVIDIKNQDVLKDLHVQLINSLNNSIVSRYPERESENYYAHITAEYNGEFAIPVDEYTNKTFALDNIWLLKDVKDENSLAFIKIK